MNAKVNLEQKLLTSWNSSPKRSPVLERHPGEVVHVFNEEMNRLEDEGDDEDAREVGRHGPGLE